VTPIAIPPIVVDRMLTALQAATILGVAVETLKKWRQRSGKGPKYVKYPDGAIRYRLSTVMKFIEDHIVEI
jgi:predicted site-specific integrase-resolvase